MAALETHADDARRLLLVRRWSGGDQVLLAFNFGDQTTTMQIPFAPAAWEALFETEAAMEGNSLRLPPSSFALYGA